GTEIPAISKHINNIYNVGELDKNSTISILEILFTPVFRISVSTTLRLKSLGSCMALSTRAFTNPSLSSALNALCS
ncbi:MAG: hypothetical protein FWC26_06405, partial [Fibromonadales bacterium]|nr:hypothetical protein [Fibromonadales bacterium]